MSVLLVEDDATLREFLQVLARRSGIAAETLDRGDSALNAIRTGRFDAIVLDLVLPGMSGFDVLRSLHQTHPHLLRRTIVLTAVPTGALHDLPFEALVWDLIRKPFDIQRLVRSVTDCLAFHSVARLPIRRDLSSWLDGRSVPAGAKAGVIAVTARGRELELQATFGYPAGVAETYFPLPLNAPFPICSAVRTGRPVWLASVVRESADYPLLAPIWRAYRSQAIAALPLINPRVVGVIGWGFSEPQRFDEQQQDSFLQLATECLPLLELPEPRAASEGMSV